VAERDAQASAVQSSAPSSAALARLGLDGPVCDLTRPNVDEWAVRRIWEGIQAGKSLPPGRERPHVMALAAFAAVASVLALILASTQLIASLREPAPRPDAASSTAASSTAALPPTGAPGSVSPGVSRADGSPAGAPPSGASATAAVAAGGADAVAPLLTRDARRFELLEAPPALPHSAVPGNAVPASAVAASGAPTARVDFADGSSIEASPGARVEALASSAGEFAVAVRRGLAQFRVTPGGPRRWRIDGSHARVEVLGTVLWVESDDGGTSVRVDVGRVLVHSPDLPGGSRHVDAGQSLRLGAPPPAPDAAGALRAPEATGGEPAAAARAAPNAQRARSSALHERPRRANPEAPVAHRERARDGAGAVPVRSRAGVATAAAALWESADEARRNGQPALAALRLTELVEEYPADSQVALAAFTLGVLQLDHLARPFEASEWFQRALELGLGAALREDAYLRWAEALSRARDHARLDMVSAEYARQYPRGRHGRAIEELAVAASNRAPPASNRSSPRPREAAKRRAIGVAAPPSDDR